MPIDLEFELTQGFAALLIAQKARQLVRRPEFSKSDRDDLRQELIAHLLERYEKFDPEVAHWNVFVTTVVERHVATILERQSTSKRLDGHDMVSLGILVSDDDGALVELAQQLGTQHRERVTGYASTSDEEVTEAQCDAQAILERLPPPLQKLAEQLMTHTVSELAREWGIPRSTLDDRLEKIRAFLADGDHVEQPEA